MRFLAVSASACLVLSGCSASGSDGFLSGTEYLTNGADAPVQGGEGVPVEVGKTMSYSLTTLSATTKGKNPRITDVDLDADEGIELVGVGWLDSSRSNGAIVVMDFPPESYYRDFPQDRASYHEGLPSDPIPGGNLTWSLIGGLKTDRLGPTRIHSVTVTYDVDGDTHEQTFEMSTNLCGYKADPKTVKCEAPAPD